MNKAIVFNQVSKRYKLGVTRISLPNLLSQGIRRILKPRSAHASSTDILQVLNNVSFELERGQSLALVGSNGAGKTTILKLLAKITKPNSGEILVNGKLSALIELGAGFHPDLSGRENIFLNGTILGLSRKEITSRFDEIVEFSELARFIDTPVKRYSSGMIVRLGFAVASCIQPEILLVDEVLAVGDAAFRQKCLKRIQSLIQGGTSIVFVSHNLYMVQAVCHKALYLKKGEVQLLGDTRDVIEAYERDLHTDRAKKFVNTKLQAGGEESGIEITRVDVVGGQEQPDNVLSSKEPAQIKVLYNAYRDVGRANMSIFLIRSDGVTCFMLRTKPDGFNLDVKKGTGVVSVDLKPIQLISGTYFVEAWFLDEADSMGITPMGGRSNWFSVKGVARSYEDSSGVYEPIAEWFHQQNEWVSSEAVDGDNLMGSLNFENESAGWITDNSEAEKK